MRVIAGWECSLTKNTALVECAIPAAAARRAWGGHPLTGDTIHHSDARSRYTATNVADTLMLAGLIPSVGTVGDALDNALAEPEEISFAWVHWYNTGRLMHRLDRRQPAEAEAE